MPEPCAAGGSTLVYAQIHDLDARVRLRQLLDDLPGERIGSSIYEVFTEDWDTGLWEKEVGRMQEFVDPAVDTLIFWQVLEEKWFGPALQAGARKEHNQ